VIQFDALPAHPFSNALADELRVFSYSTTENNALGAAKRGYVSANVFDDAITK